MKGSDFSSDYVDLLNYKCYKIKRNCDGSWIDSPNWIKNKNSTVNPFYKYDSKCFQYAAKVALNHKKIGKNIKK